MDMDDGLFGEDPSPISHESKKVVPVFQVISTEGTLPVDFESALVHFDGDRDFMWELLKQYKEQLPGSMTEIRTAMRDGDSNRLARLAHTLKGLSLNFSADSLAKFALGLEEISKREDLANV